MQNFTANNKKKKEEALNTVKVCHSKSAIQCAPMGTNKVINLNVSPRFLSSQAYTSLLYHNIPVSLLMLRVYSLHRPEEEWDIKLSSACEIPLEGLLTLFMISFNSYSYSLSIGYEHLHDIIMNNLQNTFIRTNSRTFTAFPPLPGLPVKDLNSDAQGRFILKPRDSSRSQQQSESSIFLQVKSQFPFQWGIKYQCMLSFSCLREGHCRKQT